MSICFCASGCGSNPMADPGVFPDCHCWCHERAAKPNPYEAACARFNAAVEGHRKAGAEAHRILTEAEVEWNEAQADLARYEISPGIPQPQYREEAHR